MVGLSLLVGQGQGTVGIFVCLATLAGDGGFGRTRGLAGASRVWRRGQSRFGDRRRRRGRFGRRGGRDVVMVRLGVRRRRLEDGRLRLLGRRGGDRRGNRRRRRDDRSRGCGRRRAGRWCRRGRRGLVLGRRRDR